MPFDLKGTLDYPLFGRNVSLYRSVDHGMTVLHCNVPGPLVSLGIIVPTAAENNKGVMHVLEHLVFLGSRRIPYAGFLDSVANRCLSTGTNAVTSTCFTAYTVMTAGEEGFFGIFPELLQYVLNPLLSDSGFVTEVYHIDSEGDEQGVVFCEMAARNNTEEDLCANSWRRRLFPGSPIGFETAGLTAEIPLLTMSEVRSYHERFYRPDNITLIVNGMVHMDRLFAKVDELCADFVCRKPLERPWVNPSAPRLRSSSSEIIHFGAFEESVGSVVLAWEGPDWGDLRLRLAIEVLFRYLQDQSSSPLQMEFVECSDPVASSIDFEFFFPKTSIVLEFGGVEVVEDGIDYLKPGVLSSRVLEVLQGFCENGFPKEDALRKTVRRHLVKTLESFEDEPFETFEDLLLPDVLFSENSPCSDFVTRHSQFEEILGSLAEESDSFWTGLLRSFVVSAPLVETIMKPSMARAEEISKQNFQRREARRRSMGSEGLQFHSREVEAAKAFNGRPLPSSLLTRIPPIPKTENIPTIPFTSSFDNFDSVESDFPFSREILSVPTIFLHAKVYIATKNLTQSNRAYLPLFLELLLSTSVEMGGRLVPFDEVNEEMCEETVSMSCGLGFGSSTFSSSCLTDFFYLYGIGEVSKGPELAAWLVRLLCKTRFSVDRIASVVCNLRKTLSEEVRAGESICMATSFLFTEVPGSVDVEISFFRQKRFLERIDNMIGNGSGMEVIAGLESLRANLLADPRAVFVQFGAPTGSLGGQLASAFGEMWEWEPRNISESVCLSFDEYFNQNYLTRSYPIQKQVIVPMSGVESSYVIQTIPCSVLKGDPNFFPICLVAELLCIMDGPLFSSIRGHGFAYDVQVDYWYWHGLIAFVLSDSSSPAEAVALFRRTLNEMDEWVTESLVQTATASLIYKLHLSRSSGPLLIEASFFSRLRQFFSIDEEKAAETQLLALSRRDVLQARDAYFRRFYLETDEPLTTVCVCNSSQSKRIRGKWNQQHRTDLSEHSLSSLMLK